MDRREFIKISGVGAASLAAVSCAPRTSSQASLAEVEGNVVQNYEGVGLLGYGCMRWPTYKDENGKDVIDQEQVNALVDKALEHGVNYFDTSPVYLEGESERASAIALNRHPRSEWKIATKLSNFANCSLENSKLMYRRSLEIFQTDYIDYYLLHSVKGMADFERRFGSTGIMDFLMKERALGHIRNLGFSFHGHKEGFDELMSLHEKYHWDFVQIQMNYLDWNHASSRNTNASYLYAELEKRDIPAVMMEPLRGGNLANLPGPLSDVLKEREPQKSIASWAFRYVGSFPKVLTVLSGMTYMEHLDDNLRTYTDFKPLNDEEFAVLENIASRYDSFKLIRCTSCKYCMPCPYGIDIPGLFSFYNNAINDGTYVENSSQKGYARAKRKFLLSYNKAIQTVRQADHCIGCGRCTQACPQHIQIPREIRRIDIYIDNLRRDRLPE